MKNCSFDKCTYVLAIAVYVVCFSAGVAGETTPATRTQPTHPELRPYKPGSDWLHGTFSVYENRGAKKGRKLSLYLIVLPALDKKNKLPDPVFFLHGGPGAAATTMAKSFARSPIRRKRDIVLVDQRGTGKSNPLHVKLPGGPNNIQGYLEPIFQPAAFRKALPKLQKIADLRFYTTPIAMDDLDDVRAALGYEKINLIGGSYGTRAALVYMRRHEKHVRTATLIGVAPPSFRNPLHHAKSAQEGLEKIFADVAGDPKASKAFPNLKVNFQKVLATIKKKPVKVTVKDQKGNKHDLVMDHQAFSSALHWLMYYQGTNRKVPLLIHKCAQGDFKPFVVEAVRGNIRMRGLVAAGMTMCVVGSEDIPRISEEDIVRETMGTFRGDGRVRQMIAVSKFWPRGEVPANYGDPVKAKTPTLLISGSHDPITPPKWGEKAARHLPNSLHLMVPGMHGVSGSELERIKMQFLEKGTIKGLDITWIKRMRLPKIVLPAATQSISKTQQWVERIILGPEFGGAGKVCVQWVKSPTLSVFGGNEPQQLAVKQVVAHLNESLAKTRLEKMRLLKANNAAANIRVYFAPLADFAKIAKKHGFRYYQGNLGYVWTFWNNRREIERAYVLLASDKLHGRTLRHFALEEITQSLGLLNDSLVYRDSVFYGGREGDGGDAQELSVMDKKLIRFFYIHVRPGAMREDVRKAFGKYWKKA